MFFSHTTGSLGVGHVTERLAVAFVASAILTFPPTRPKISVFLGYDVYVFKRSLNKGQAAVGLAWLPVVCEK